MCQKQKSTTRTVQSQRSTTFMPRLCSRPSVKNALIPKSKSHTLHDHIDGANEEDEPLSPKISCIGKVIRTNKITNIPITKTTPNHHSHGHGRYFSFKRLFSLRVTKSLSSRKARTSPRPEDPLKKNSNGSKPKIDERGQIGLGFVVDMDPPLPVVKTKNDGGEKAAPENLWKRRSGGLELRSLQIPKTLSDSS